MGVFDSLRRVVGGPPTPGPEEAASDDAGSALRYDGPSDDAGELTPSILRERAVEATDRWSAYDLDFTVASLDRLDDVAREHAPSSDRDPTSYDHQPAGGILEAGSYLGEVVARQFGGEWTWNDRWTVTVFGSASAGTIPVFDVAARSFHARPQFRECVADLEATLTRLDDREDVSDPKSLGVEMAAKATEFAATWDTYDLDFSPASLSRLDELVATEFDHREFATVPLYETGGDESMVLTARSLEAGAYLTEVFRREVGGEWRDDDGFHFVVDADDPVPVRPVEYAAECYRGTGSFRRLYDVIVE